MIKFSTRLRIFLLFLLGMLIHNEALQAHEPDHSYVYLRIYKDAIGGRFEMTAKDMNRAIGSNLAIELDASEVEKILPQIQAYLKSHATFSANGKTYTIKFTDMTVLDLEEAKVDDFARINFDLEGVTTVPEKLDISYNALFDNTPKHRGVLVVEYNWKAGIVNNAMIANLFEPSKSSVTLDLSDANLWKGFVALVKLGVWHIWIGLDHILFIVALILPGVVRRKKPEAEFLHDPWIPVEAFKPAFFYILKIITFFTIAHSITLALASLKIVNLNIRMVESIIAISIALAAYHNIRPIFKGREWVMAFGFGLFHGFGFASVLGDKGLGGDYMLLSLFGFNVGVELGQVLIICMIFPILYLIRKSFIYPYIIKYGSMVLIFISIYWFIERAFDVDLPLGAYFWKIYYGIFGGNPMDAVEG